MKRSHYHKLLSLGEQTTIESQVSDHQLLISGGVLFFNMMMQGRYNAEKNRYNNGFALVESRERYQSRIVKTVRVLAEALYTNPQIFAIGLAEAPIQEEDIALFRQEASFYPSLSRFLDTITQESFTNMGIANFFDTESFLVVRECIDYRSVQPSLRERFQRSELTNLETGESFSLVTLHLPYDLAKSEDSQPLINFVAELFASGQPTMVMGDFNIDPDVIAGQLPFLSVEGLEYSNVLLNAEHSSTNKDCVDAVFRNSPKRRNAAIKELSADLMIEVLKTNSRLSFFNGGKLHLQKAFGSVEKSEQENGSRTFGYGSVYEV